MIYKTEFKGNPVVPVRPYKVEPIGCVPQFTTAQEFAKKKAKMLEKDFKIKLTDKEKAHLFSLETETQINNAIRSIIDNHWGM